MYANIVEHRRPAWRATWPGQGQNSGSRRWNQRPAASSGWALGRRHRLLNAWRSHI